MTDTSIPDLSPPETTRRIQAGEDPVRVAPLRAEGPNRLDPEGLARRVHP